MSDNKSPAKPIPANLPSINVNSIGGRYVVAVLAAFTAELVTYPFDLTKTRLQIQSEVATQKAGFKLVNDGMIRTAIGIVKKEGPLKLWSGLMPMFHRHAVYSGCRMIFYEKFRNYFKDEKGKVSMGIASFGGLCSGALSQFIASPADLVKVQMQAEGRRIVQGKKPRFTSCTKLYGVIYRESGILGFWRGALPNVLRAAAVNLGDLAAYDLSKQILVKDFKMADNIIVHGIAASTAGFVAAVACTPFDVMKTRLMNQPLGPDGKSQHRLGSKAPSPPAAMSDNKSPAKPIPANLPSINVNSIGGRYVVAVLAAFTAELVTYPFDLTKTRLQIQSEVATQKAGFKLVNDGMIRTAIGIVKKEGPLKLWSGLMPMFHRHAVYSGCRMIFYEKFRNYFKDEKGKVSMGIASFGGLCSGALSQFIASPADLVKVQMQAEGRRIVQGKKPRFTSCTKLYGVIYRESGILGFWRGALPNVLRAAAVNLGDLAAYDLSKQILVKDFKMADNIIVHGIAASTAGFVAAVACTPFDVMKTRLMNQPLGPDGKGILYTGLLDCFRQSVKNEGFLAIYKGFLPIWLRLGPWALTYWVAFENIMILIGGRTF